MINKKSINLLFKEIIPSSIKKTKYNAKEIQNEVITNNHKIYSEKNQIPVENIIANYFIPEEVAPFAQRILNPIEFNQETGLAKTLKKIKKTKIELANIKDSEIKNSFQNLYKKIINETSNIDNLSDGIKNLSKKIELIENDKTKKLIITEINKLTKLNKKEFKSNFTDKMAFIETATDAVNIMNDKYINLKSEPRELYKWLNKHNSWFTDAIDGNIRSSKNYRNKFATHKDEEIDYKIYLEKLETLKKEKLPETFQNNLKLEAFRDLVDRYNDFEPELIKGIYYNEYLKTQPPEIQAIFKNINKTYNTFVINSNAKFKVNDAKYIEEELKLWQEAGLNNTTQPKIINVDYLDKTLNQNNYVGIAFNIPKKITVKALLDLDCNPTKNSITLRHEINHLNDDTIRPKNDIERLYDALKWNINKLIYKNKWQTELKNAGVSDFSADYAMKNKHELKSVTAESIMEYLSKKFKKQLVQKFKMKDWIFNLKPNKIRLDEISKKIEQENKAK